MTTWLGRTLDGTYGLLIEEQVLRDLDGMCRDAGTVETGGVLVGRYSEDLAVAIVREATPPPLDSERGASWFNRGVAGLRDKLRRRWESQVRSYYLGEWHYHPSVHVEPSATDIGQMFTIRDDSNYHCTEPVVVIFGQSGDGDERPVRAFVFPRSSAYAEIVRLPTNSISGRAQRRPLMLSDGRRPHHSWSNALSGRTRLRCVFNRSFQVSPPSY
jgi:integrative and conjugative element protein (TIGR02256 family)